MKLIITLLALSALYAAEGTQPQKPELPADVKAKMEEIHQMRLAHRQAMEAKFTELKAILENYPKLREHILKRLEDRRQERRDARKEEKKEHHKDK